MRLKGHARHKRVCGMETNQIIPKLFRRERGESAGESLRDSMCKHSSAVRSVRARVRVDTLDLELFILGPHFFSLARVQSRFRIRRDNIWHKLGSSALIIVSMPQPRSMTSVSL